MRRFCFVVSTQSLWMLKKCGCVRDLEIECNNYWSSWVNFFQIIFNTINRSQIIGKLLMYFSHDKDYHWHWNIYKVCLVQLSLVKCNVSLLVDALTALSTSSIIDDWAADTNDTNVTPFFKRFLVTSIFPRWRSRVHFLI